MKPDRLLTLQQELYSVLTESRRLKIGIKAPPWDLITWQRVKSLAKYLNETEQSVVPDSNRLNEWLDKCSFYEQACPKSVND